MSTEPTVQQPGRPRASPGTAAARFDRWQRAGGWVAPVLTAILAFLVGGLVVLATGTNPVSVYKGIWDGTGLEWFYQVGVVRGRPAVLRRQGLVPLERATTSTRIAAS